MPSTIPVRLLLTGFLRGALEEAFAVDPEVEVVETGARVVVSQGAGGWKSPPAPPDHLAVFVDPAAVILLTSVRDPYLIEAALAGVQVFVDLQDPAEDLLTAVHRADRRQAFCSTSLHGALTQALRSGAGRRLFEAEACHSNGLTHRELEVARLAARHVTRDAIARELCVSIATVKTHLANARRKMGLRKNSRFEQLEGA
jgi:DNA-binding NarL/FixJ family response regulator